jgi:two-component system, OmpR family, phosphate regulon sensor histidine kinase PhoR
VTYRTRTLIGALIGAAAALGVAVTLVSTAARQTMRDDIRAGLVREARLSAELLATRTASADLDADADALGRTTGSRITLIAADGTVLGDSAVAVADLATLENHAARPEVVAALASGVGVASRLSHTTGIETMYAAAPVRTGQVAVVRVALPLSIVADRLTSIVRLSLMGLAAGLAVALIVTWLTSFAFSRRLSGIVSAAERYGHGDFSLPVRDYGRDEVGRVANALDQTARQLGARLAEMARDRAHTHAILGGMVEGVVLINAGGRLVLTNPAVRQMLRLPDPVEDRQYVEVVRDPAITAQVSGALRGETPAPVEVQLDGDGRRIFVCNVVPVPAERGGGAVLVLHDVTDARRADQMRRDFVANVSHELRTPLTAIRGYVEALLDGPPADDQARHFLEIIARHAMRMERLVRDLLRLARLDAGQEPLARATCVVASVARGVEHDMETAIGLRHQRLTLEIAPDAETVQADPAKLHDILRNLVENASHYSPEGGLIELSATRQGETIEIAVADRGSGIPDADLSRIFERFYRVDRSRTRDPGGTGLGLSIVRHLVELHGGRAWAANRDGGGAIVAIRLPAQAPGPLSRAAAS